MTENQLAAADDHGHDVAAGVRAAVDAAVIRLVAAQAHDEALAEYIPRRRVLGLFTKAPALLPRGRVWRLGVFLLGADGTLYATGHTTRAVPPKYPGFQSVSAEERRAYRAAAFAGPFSEGETVNFDARRIGLSVGEIGASGGPLIVVDGVARVLWNAAAAPATASDVRRYLDERIDLLLSGTAPE